MSKIIVHKIPNVHGAIEEKCYCKEIGSMCSVCFDKKNPDYDPDKHENQWKKKYVEEKDQRIGELSEQDKERDE